MSAGTLYRTTLLAAVLGVTAVANAYTFNVLGTCDSNGIITSTSFLTSSLPEFNTSYTYVVGFGLDGSFNSQFNNGASLLAMSGTGGSVVNSNNTYSFSGAFTVNNANATSVLVGSTGTYSATFDLNDGLFSYSLAGAPTPEPTTIAALGLGALAIVRRRKRKATV